MLKEIFLKLGKAWSSPLPTSRISPRLPDFPVLTQAYMQLEI